MSPLIVSALRKSYDGREVVAGLNFELQRGECYGLLGPNGAGKTTTLRCCLGLTAPDSGRIALVGEPVPARAREARMKIGVVPQFDNLDPDFTAAENLIVYGRYFGMKDAAIRAKIADLLDFAGLAGKEEANIRTLSGGMKRRVMIAKALSHEPQILFLDEPTAGVDVELRRDMWDMVRALRDSGVTIILTTHYIEEAELMADRIGVISKGELIVVEEKAALMQKLGKKQLRLQLRRPLERIPDALAGGALELAAGGTELFYTFDTQEDDTGIEALLHALGEQGIAFKDLQSSESSLEEIFVGLVRAQA